MSKELRKFNISFEDPSLTLFGGMVLFQQFCRKLGLRRILRRHIRWQRRSSLYHPIELIMTIIYTMVAGMKRVSDTRVLRYNGYFQSLLGLRDFPRASTLREFLKSLTRQEIEGLMRINDILRQRMWHMPHPTSSLILELDSTVMPVFGWKIEEANVGYNPKKRGRPSYHPLLCFNGHTRDSWHGLLRSGDTHAATGILPFWEVCRKKIPRYLYRIRLRADSGFFSYRFVELLDDQKIGYAIVAKMSKPLQIRVQSLRYRTFRQGGWQAASFTYQPYHFKRQHRFFVIRRPLPKAKRERAQTTLWKFKDYFYHTLISNLDLQPSSIWHFYKRRARVELDVRELKESFPLTKVPTNTFLANQAFFHLILLTYDLVNFFKRTCLPVQWKTATLQTIRKDFLVLPGRLIHSGILRNQLKLPLYYTRQKHFHQTLKNIDRFNIG